MHELIHAYDFCRAKVDIDNCDQYACLEVRASSLSGECNYLPEAARGNLGVGSGHSSCTRRRALLSVSMNNKCSAEASKHVDKVFERCYRDISPYLDDNDTPQMYIQMITTLHIYIYIFIYIDDNDTPQMYVYIDVQMHRFFKR